MISKILLQKSKDKVPEYVVNMIKANLMDDWQYINYTNGDEIKFFNDNPLDEFPNIVTQFNSIEKQQHKADLFRYYYLYIKGGVYLDSDAMIQDNIMNIIKEYDFVTVNGFNKGTIFNGFIATTPMHPIMYEALKNIYNMSVKLLKVDYFAPCKFLYTCLLTKKYDNIFIYNEYIANGIGYTYDKDRMCLVKHYPVTKIIPQLSEDTVLVPTRVGWSSSILKKFAYYKK